MHSAPLRSAEMPSNHRLALVKTTRGRQLLCAGLLLLAAATLPACSKPNPENKPAAPAAAQAEATTPAGTPAAAKPEAAAKENPAATTTTPAAAAATPQDEVRAAIESWRQDWQSQDQNKYIAHYDPSFHAPGMDLAKWRGYKNALNKKYKGIDIKISDLEIRMTKKGALATFKQEYRSDKFHGHSKKQLALMKVGDQWKIYRENSM